MALIQFNNIFKGFSGEYILKNLNFSVDEKDKIGLIGQNGAGKTTLVKMILGEESHDVSPETNVYGTITKKGNISIGYLSQNFDLNEESTIFDELLSVYSDVLDDHRKIEILNEKLATELDKFDEIIEELAIITTRYEKEEGYNLEYKIKQILTGLNFPENMYNQKITDLSGGQKSRVALGKILLREPELLILDEPTNHLDISAIEWLEEFLKSYNKAFILISHDRYFLNNVVKTVYELERKEISIYKGNFDEYVIQKEIYLSGAMKAYEKEQEKIAKTEEFIERYRAGIKSKQARGRESILSRMEKMENPIVNVRKMKLKFTVKRASTDRVLKLKGLEKSFEDKKLFSNLDIDIFKEDRIGLIGKNGIGKSTLLKIVNGLETADKGEILFGEKLDIGYYDQEHQNINRNNTILEELLYSYPISEEDARRMAGGFLFTEDDVNKKISSLSGGERARVSFMKLIKDQPNFLILDEPTNHLDIYSREVLEESLMDYDGTLLIVSHDRYFLESIVNKIYHITESGAELFKGDYENYKKEIENKKEQKVNNNEYEEQKKNKNRINSLKKQIEKFEKDIEEKEEEKAGVEAEYQKAGLKNDVGLLMELQEKIDNIDIEILELMGAWEDSEKELNELES